MLRCACTTLVYLQQFHHRGLARQSLIEAGARANDSQPKEGGNSTDGLPASGGDGAAVDGSDGSGTVVDTTAAGSLEAAGRSCWTRWFCSKMSRLRTSIWEVTDGELPDDNALPPDPNGVFPSRKATYGVPADDVEHFPALSRIYIVFSMAVLLAAVILLIVETLPEFRLETVWGCVHSNGTFVNPQLLCYPEPGTSSQPPPSLLQASLSPPTGLMRDAAGSSADSAGESTFVSSEYGPGDVDENGCTCNYLDIDTEVAAVYIAEATFVTWFTLEFVVRWFASPNRCTFVKEALNIIDFLAILPFYMSLGISTDGFEVIRVLRLFRVFRVFKVARHSTGLKIFGIALYQSKEILGQLFIFILTVSIIFAAVIFNIEYKNTDTDFGKSALGHHVT